MRKVWEKQNGSAAGFENFAACKNLAGCENFVACEI